MAQRMARGSPGRGVCQVTTIFAKHFGRDGLFMDEDASHGAPSIRRRRRMWLSMWVPITVMAVAGMVRLACSLASWLMAMCSDRRRGRIAVTLLRAAGPGSLVLDRHPD